MDMEASVLGPPTNLDLESQATRAANIATHVSTVGVFWWTWNARITILMPEIRITVPSRACIVSTSGPPMTALSKPASTDLLALTVGRVA